MKTKNIMQKLLVLLMLSFLFVANTMLAQTLPTDVISYETVTVTIPATSYDANLGVPQMARVKYNKKFPLVVTSDDMGKTELTNNWAEVNGYPNVNNTIDLGIQPGGTKFLAAPYKKYYTQHESQDVDDYEPMTYTDNVDKEQRYRMTSAIMPYDVNSNNYAKINAEDAKLMLRTGWSFAQHDVDNTSSVENISTAMTNNSNIWANKVGIGLKVLVEPNGNHQYLDAGRQNSGVCWNIFQNAATGHPFNSRAVSDWTHNRTNWTATGVGTLPTTFSSKPEGGYARSFFQGHESEWKNEVNNADGSQIIIGGTHGLGDEIKQHLRTAANVKDNAWVASADEVWEYYHIYNNVKIGDATFKDGKLTFDVHVPTYQKNQYRELTLNIPGLTGGEAPTFTNKQPVTGGYKQTTDAAIGYTMNIGLESSINEYINELMTIFRDDQTNEFVKRDIRYLASQLWDDSDCIASLEAAPFYSHTINARLDGTSDSDYPPAMIKTDTNGDKSFRIPRYVAKNGSLYETAGAAAGPKYAKTIATAGTSSDVDYTNKNLDSSVVLYAEGEDLEGTTVIGADLEYNEHQDGRYYATNVASMGMAGSIVSGSPATVSKTLPRGKYKITVGYGESYKSQGTYNYNVKVGDTQVYTFANSDASDKAVTEFTSSDFNVEQDNTPVTITTDNTNTDSRWIDYVYVQKTADLAAIAPTMTFTSSTTASTIKTGTTATLTANALPNGGSNLTTSIYAADSEGNISGSALATGVESASYAFTPDAAGTSYFLAQSTNSAGVTKSELIALTATAITDYTLKIIDKSGGTAMTATIANPGSPAQTDPLPVAYRSPFAENYHYYLTAEDAQNNNTANALANTDVWTNANIYVGYDVKSTFGADKKFAVWANNRYMHMVYRINQAQSSNDYFIKFQKYNISDVPSVASSDGLSYHTISTSDYTLLDNHFMWNLGDDPYNVVFENVANQRYLKTQYNESKSKNNGPNVETSILNGNRYCIIYWQAQASGSSVESEADYYRLYDRTLSTNSTLAFSDDGSRFLSCTNNNDCEWRTISNIYDDSYDTFTKIYIKTLPEITVNVLNSHGDVEAQIQAYNNTAANMQSFVPYSMLRAYTSGHKFFYDAAHADKVTAGVALSTSKLEANGSNLYMTYDLVDDKWRKVVKDAVTYYVHSFDAEADDDANWYGLRYNNGSNYIMASALSSNLGNTSLANITGTNADTDNGKKGQWVLIGTPYHLELANRYLGIDNLLGIPSDATSSSKPQVRAAGTSDVITTWEVVTWLNQGKSHLFFRPQGGFNAQAPNLFLSTTGGLAGKPGGGEMWDFYWAAETTEHYDPAATLTLSAASADAYVDEATALTATATPDEGHSVTYFAIERETSTDVWKVVGTAYEGSDVSGVAEKNATTGVVTLNCNFIPSAEGTYNLRARAVCDNNAENYTILSTNTARDGGIGSVVTITATVKPFTVGSDNYTIVLVDKAGNELYTESNVPASRVSEANSVSGRNGDPLNNNWRSPLVTRYYYYNTAEGAKTNNSSDLFDWASTATTPTVYVGYEVGTDIDLNTKVTDISERVRRSNDDATMVRNASKFGTMYMLKFLNGVGDYMENGKDAVEDTKKKPVYPYANGDGAMYIYDQNRWDAQAEAGASTRTRWPWYLVSPTNDPYHVYVTAWQQSHTDEDTKTNYYNFFRTYYNNTISKVVTTSISDDPKATNTSLTGGATTNVPTQYMLLGTTGHYKLVTSDAVAGATADATYGVHQTVKTLENYWKNNPTVQTLAGVQNPEANNATLTNKGWHRYESWAYAANWGTDSKNKIYSYGNHWYKTFEMGDGTFDLEPTEIDAVLVLLDNHGWEVMRQKIAKHKEADKYAAAQAALRKFDSPMVEQYKFYGSKSDDHKVRGYHKYNINNGANKALTESDRAGADDVFTSLADYPEKYAGGALMDLYVTYVVKPEYASTYQGAATVEGTSASQFVLRQGNNYAKANGTAIEGTTQENADKWYLKPNFNIDTEMGYKYDVDKDGLKTGTILDAAANNANYYNNGQQGFDPYNLRIQNVSTSTYLTTNATTADLTGSIWSGDGTTVSLTDATSYFTDKGLDGTDVQISNATFMAVQDANGNMRLMPRFDFSKVVEGFTTLKEQAAAQPAGNTTHAQTTLLSTPVTYHIIDNSGADVFDALTANTAGFAVPKEYRSPMVEEYYYHSSLEDAKNNRTTASVTTVKPGDEVWVSYKAKEDFGSKDWIIYDTQDHFMHAVSRNLENNAENLWWMSSQNCDRGSNATTTTLSTTTMPFLDNSFAWQFGNEGNTADPYNAKMYNKAAHWYVQQNANTSNNGRMDHLKPNIAVATPYAIVYYNADESNGNVILYDRAHKRYVYYDSNEWRNDNTSRQTTGELVFTQLPAISINIVDANKEVECTLEGFYNKNASWSTPFVPLYLERYAASNQAFYYDQACENAISGQVNDATVTANKAVYVSYTLDAAKWGTLDNTANTTIVMPSPTNDDKVEWYSMVSNNKTFFIDGNNQLVSGSFKAGDDVDTNDNKKGQWALMGTPYNVKIVNRYAGSTSYLGIPSEINNNPIQLPATVQPEGTENVVDTWEVCQGMGNSGYVLQFRPQGSLSGQATYGYLGQDGNTNGKLGVTVNPNGNLQVKLTWKKETDAKIVTFKLYDREGNYMADEANGAIADAEIHGVSIGDGLASVFAHTNMQRRYCEYTFYSDAEMTNAVTKASEDLNETVYVKWDYTDDAPVFSQPGWDKRDYQYYMLGVWGFSNYNLMDVEGEGTTESPYTFKPNNTVGTPRDLKHQFAIVGSPYGFKLYNRAADKDIRRNKNLEITFADKEADGTATEEITFDMPVVSGAEYTNTECHFRSTLTGRYLNITGSNGDSKFAMGDGAGRKTRFRYLIVPLHVFYEENTTLAAQKDYRMYGLELNPNNTARQTTDRFNTDAMRASDNKIGLAFDFNHAFCDYTFYRSYDWTTGALSDAIPEGGLSYYGGKIQTKRQFFATYTVDWDQFGKLYLIALPANGYPGDETQAKPFLGKGNPYSYVDGYWLKSENSSVTTVRADNEGTYRFKFIGDPYDMQIINIGTKDENMVLGAKCTTYVGTGQIGQGLMTLNKNETYSKMSHFEIIKRSNGNHVFYLLDDENGRFFSSLHPSNNNIQTLIAYTINDEAQTLTVNDQMSRIKEFLIIPAIPQHSVTWNIVDDNHQIVATKVVANAEKGTEFTLDDLPETLKRHYCDYNNMYSDQWCTEQYTDNKVTLGSEGINIYVPYELNSGAPNFVTEVPGTESADDKYWYETAFPHAEVFVYASDADVKNFFSLHGVEKIRDGSSCPEGTTWDSFRWALIGTPYGVQLYNRATSKYLCIDDGQVKVSDTGTTFDLMDDWQNELCAIYDKVSKTYLVRSQNDVATTTTNGSYTSAEFSNQDGLTTFDFRLHYSGDTQRLDGVGGSSMKGAIENIHIISFQKKGKKLIDVLPEYWKRAFCNYKFYWNDATTDESYTAGSEVTTITDAMVTKSQQNENNSIYIHITYTVDSPFEWSSQDEQSPEYHWYYLVNNHRPAGEQGKMVFRTSNPDLRVSESLVDSKLYLNNYEWAVIGDPYGFKLLNRYDPDKRFDEYISVSTEYKDGNGEGYKLEQVAGKGQSIFEMMRGQHSYNFWIHPAYDDYSHLWEEYNSGDYSFVSNNYNGSNAIIPDTKRTMKYLKTSSAANYRLEIQSDHTLAEYVKYAGFVGGLKYAVANGSAEVDGNTVNVATLSSALLDGTATEEQKATLHKIIDDPDNIVQMEQGYYRIIPYAQEGGTSHNYVTGYHDIREIEGATGITWNMKVVSQDAAEYDPATIFWFEGTTEDETNYPRYFVRTQGLYLQQNRLKDSGSPYKVRYEDLGAAITQLKVDNATGTRPSNYLSVSSPTAAETTINQCFDEQVGVYKTRFYLQKVGEANKSEMGFKAKLMDMNDGYSYVSLYVPFDVDIDKGVAFIGKQEYANSKSGQDIEGTSWKEAPYKLRCYSVNDQTGKTQRYIPAGTPVLIRVATNEANVENNNSTYTDALYVKANVSTIQGENGEIINAPSAAVSSEFNKFRGQYLAQVLPLQNNEVVYVHGLSSKYGPGFFKNGNTYEGVKNNAYVKNNKLYYTSIVSSGAKSFGMAMFVDGIEDFSGSTTGIQSISSDQDIDWENAEVYDLQGRRVRDPQRGIYIVNGKKVVIK